VKCYKRQEVVRKEALSKINYLNAVDFYLKSGIKKSDNAAALKETIETLRGCMKHLPL
jgi:hypothetical protein